ncbi:hypothetical protein RMAECT_1534 [Rickettsia rhipicephali str. Ect]|uniref:Uncharacterized protein n=1 Tax=Rickettsia rhipicephali str. Ect TaxID=1359199 RepID=A0A0F3PHM2_RICRH|nr:hypothetical protein RMAECT_1534 [Rickettsia rhipicephali str. Ect]
MKKLVIHISKNLIICSKKYREIVNQLEIVRKNLVLIFLR